jgi:small subunit ribosomal protein S4
LDERRTPRWLSLDPAALSGQVLQLPEREDVDVSIDEQLIVEYYSR